THTSFDPIFGLLNERANFGFYLHERPLYLLKRSLLLENEALYNRAVALYSARNKIGHEGVISAASDNPYKNAGSDEAELAMDIGMAVINWFYKAETYVHPKMKSVKFYSVKANVPIRTHMGMRIPSPPKES
ncbi:MAG: hypothetical protein JWN14_2339, partial [Chthonomonadales bacterium]|nr:hypothetical protein [Chthonomonadales bacterium]